MTEPIATSRMTSTLRANIEALTTRQRVEARAAPLATRIANIITAFTGSMTFVALHLIVFGIWAAGNLGAIPGFPRFDPQLIFMATEASVEAIFLSTFVLISQNRMSAEADRRANLDLHVNLLTEHELTRLADLIGKIAERVGVVPDDPEMAEITRDVAPVEVLDAIDARRRSEGLD